MEKEAIKVLFASFEASPFSKTGGDKWINYGGHRL